MSKSKKILFFLGTGFLLVALVLGGIYLFNNVDQVRALRHNFESVVVSQADLKADVSFAGKVDSEEHVTLQFQQIPTTGATIGWVGVKVGNTIKKNQILASLDTASTQKLQQQFLSSYLKTRYQFDLTNYNLPGVGTQSYSQQSTANQAQTDLNNAVYNVELQQIALDQSVIKSPIQGIVIRADITNGGVNIATADEAKYEIVNPLKIFFNVDIDEGEVINYHKGDKGIVILSAYPTEEIPATIKDISFGPHSDADGNTFYTFTVSLDNVANDDYKYRLGMTGNIIFRTLAKNVLYIPKTFLHTDDTGTFVHVGDNKKVVYIQTGIDDGQNVEVVKGLHKDDVVYY